jgi:hypothetical protein
MPLALAAKDAGYDVHVGTPRGTAVERIIGAGLTWHHLPFGRCAGSRGAICNR